MKLPAVWAQTFRSLLQHYRRQAPVARYDDIPGFGEIHNLYIRFLKTVSHHNRVIRFYLVIETGHGPDRDIVFSSKSHADLQNGPWTSIRIDQNLHRILFRKK